MPTTRFKNSLVLTMLGWDDKGSTAAKHLQSNGSLPRISGEVHTYVKALEGIQGSYTEGPFVATIETALSFRRSNLPREVQDKTFITSVRNMAFLSVSDQEFQETLQKVRNPEGHPDVHHWLKNVRSHDYILWPTELWDVHHVYTAIIRMGKSHPDLKYFDMVKEIARVDSAQLRSVGMDLMPDKHRRRYDEVRRRGVDYPEFLDHTFQNRLYELLTEASFIVDSDTQFVKLWSPAQTEQATCVQRCCYGIRQLMDRILEFHLAKKPHGWDFWRPLSGWFSPEQIRADMLGDCAWSALQHLQYRGHVAIEIPDQDFVPTLQKLKPYENDIPRVQRPERNCVELTSLVAALDLNRGRDDERSRNRDPSWSRD